MSRFDKETEDVEFFGYTAWMNSANSLLPGVLQLSRHSVSMGTEKNDFNLRQRCVLEAYVA